MVLADVPDLESEEKEITKILLSIICLYGNDGLPLDKVNEEFENVCGYAIPFKKFGADNLKSWILTLPDIYIILDSENNEVLIQQSQKSLHIKELIMKQKARTRCQVKRKGYSGWYQRNNKRPKRSDSDEDPPDSFMSHMCSSKKINESNMVDKFSQLECMLPLLYKHQALGDDFFLDIADSKLGYYVPEKGPKVCGLCTVGQTISNLTEKVKNAIYLAPRVVVMIGFQDLLWGRSVGNMISDLRQLVIELKKKNTNITLITLIPSPKLPKLRRLQTRMDVYNKAILDYACDYELKCNIIDMYTVFLNEEENFRRDFDRFTRVAKKDPYKVFSDYGRKIFLSTLKTHLRVQIEDEN